MSFPSAPPLPFDDVSNIVCSGCGIYDASLRHSAHPRVVSNLVAANESTRVAIWCARCRGIEAAKAAAISLVAGWWSLRGPARTVAAVRTNLRGGEQQPTTNAKMLRAIALREYEQRNYDFAAMFAAAANATQPQRENARLLHDLNKAGYRSVEGPSAWRFAAWAPVVVFAVVVIIAIKMAVPAKKQEPPPVAPAQSAAAAPAPEPKKPEKVTWSQNASADELQRLLTPDSDERLARAYVQARLREVGAALPMRIRRGDEIASIERTVVDFRAYPAVARFLERPAMSAAYAKLTIAFSDAMRYYHGGADVDTIERTAGESLQVTESMAMSAFEAEDRGQTGRADALGSQVDQRLESVVQMKRELHIRGAVIGLLGKAIAECQSAMNR